MLCTANVLTFDPRQEEKDKRTGLVYTGIIAMLDKAFAEASMLLVSVQEARTEGPTMRRRT